MNLFQIHRLCSTGVTQSEYRQLTAKVKTGGAFEWSCSKCAVERATIIEHLRQPMIDDKVLQTWYVYAFLYSTCDSGQINKLNE